MDWKSILCEQRNEMIDSGLPVDNQFEQDFYEIITSPSFRRLQDKTQIFTISDNDYVRTRLTHSVEIATIGGQIAKKIWKLIREIPDLAVKYGYDYNDIDKIEDVIKCAGLLHDIGNPPLGHNGEFVIRDWFKGFLEKNPDIELSEQMKRDLMSFEGNAQALRVVSKLHHSRGSKEGMNLTYAVISAIIKYPISSLELENNPGNYDKIGYYHADEELFNLCRQKTRIPQYQRNPLTYILEAADDIGYMIADVEDSVSNGIIGFCDIYRSFEDMSESPFSVSLTRMMSDSLSNDELEEILNHNRESDYHGKCIFGIETVLGNLRIELMNHAAGNYVKHYDQIMSGSFTADLIVPDEKSDEIHYQIVKKLKQLIKDKVYPYRDSLQSIQKYKKVLEEYFELFVVVMLRYDKNAPDGITIIPNEMGIRDVHIELLNHIPPHLLDIYNNEMDRIISRGRFTGESQPDYETRIRQERNYLRMLLVTDFVSGMTDRYAFENFK